jgi:DNA end-binding protein Ku
VAARAIYKAVIVFGGERLPVKLYSAVEDRNIHFRLLHEPDRVPVRQAMVSSRTGEPVPREERKKGWEIEPGVFLPLTDEDLEDANPEPTREVTVERFVPEAALPHLWYDRPYYLGPDGDTEGYFALAAALGRGEGGGREGVVRWVMRNKTYRGALRKAGPYLALLTLRSAEEVIRAEDLPEPAGREPSAKERTMAEQLVTMLEGEFEPEDYRDEYRARVREMIAAKASGKTLAIHKPRRKKKEEGSLEDLLAQSLGTGKGKTGKKVARAS